MLDLHGGGFYMGSAAGDDERNRRLADALGVAVVGVDYRLAPEHPWPAAPDDCEAAALWLTEEAGARFGTTRLAIGGTSAGATLALATLLRLRERGVAGRFAGAALLFGTYDVSARTPAGRRIADEYFIQAYAGHVEDRTVPDLSPVYGDLGGLPRRCSSSAARTSSWRTTWRWPAGCPRPATTSSCGSTPGCPTVSRRTRRPSPGRRSPGSPRGCATGSPRPGGRPAGHDGLAAQVPSETRSPVPAPAVRPTISGTQPAASRRWG